MSETFDNKSLRIGEFIELPLRVKILADAIIDLTGADYPTQYENTEESEWIDLRTNTTIRLLRAHEDGETFYFVDQYNTPYCDTETKPTKQYYTESREDADVVRIFDLTEHDAPTSEEEASDPAEELFDLLLHGPLENSKKILNDREKPEVTDRFLHILGTYALTEMNTGLDVYKAQKIVDDWTIPAIIKKMTQKYKEAGLTDEYAYQAIERYWESNPFMPPKRLGPRRRGNPS